jgi:hypothetical protein
LAMRAMATAEACGAGCPRAGEVMGEGRSIECSRGRGRRKTTRRSPQCCDGQNRAAMAWRPSGASPASARIPEGLGVTRGSSRHEWTKSCGERTRDATAQSRALRGARRQPCQPRAHHTKSCPRATLDWQNLSSSSTVDASLHLWHWFGLKWSELRGRVNCSF